MAEKEQVVTLKIVTDTLNGDPSEWDWRELTGDEVAVVSAKPSKVVAQDG